MFLLMTDDSKLVIVRFGLSASNSSVPLEQMAAGIDIHHRPDTRNENLSFSSKLNPRCFVLKNCFIYLTNKG